MRDYSKSKRSLIRDSLGNSVDGRRAEVAKSANMLPTENLPISEVNGLLKEIQQVGPLGAIYLMAKNLIQESGKAGVPIRTVEAVSKAKASVEDLVSPASDNFTNLFSPGAVSAVISALETERNRGWLPQNQVPRSVAGYFVHGGSDTKTDDTQSNYRNPESFGTGFYETIGRERYGDTRSTAGSSADSANSRSPRNTPPGDDDRQMTFGTRNPSHPSASPGRSGQYGKPTLITTVKGFKAATRVYSGGKTPTKVDEDEARFKESVAGVSQAKLEEIMRRQDELQGLKTDDELSEEALAAARKEALDREKTAETEEERKSWKQTKEDIEKSMFIKKLKRFGYLK